MGRIPLPMESKKLLMGSFPLVIGSKKLLRGGSTLPRGRAKCEVQDFRR